MDIRELLRHIRAEKSDRAVQRDLEVDARTVKKYRKWAEEQGLLEGELPPLGELQLLVKATLDTSQPPQNVSSVEPYREVVVKLRRKKVEIKAIWERLKERGYTGSYQSVWRFVRRLEPLQPEATVRVETAPGEEAQVDFGYAGRMVDPETEKERKTWAFVMTLSWSRHQYVEFVFNQKVNTWLACHCHALSYFGGVPERLVVDNLKAAIVRNCWENPEVQQSYRELAEHYGFLIAPCRPRKPQHKGKVEQGGVHYVKRNFLGGREMTTITQANRDVLVWCETTAGQRIHGTTKEQPMARFQEVEKAALNPLPEAPYDMAVWKLLKLHRDCHVTFEGSYYSVPFELIGQQVRVRGGMKQVRIYTMDYRLMATHERAEKPGTRRMNLDHLPIEKVPGLLLDREFCREQALAIGPSVVEIVNRLLDDKAVDRLRTVGRLLKLRETFGEERLEAACQRALHFDDPTYKTVKRILKENLDAEPLPGDAEPAPPAKTFVRGVIELVGAALGGVTWN